MKSKRRRKVNRFSKIKGKIANMIYPFWALIYAVKENKSKIKSMIASMIYPFWVIQNAIYEYKQKQGEISKCEVLYGSKLAEVKANCVNLED